MRYFAPRGFAFTSSPYYDPALPGYHDYPAGADAETTCAEPTATPNTANCLVTVVGAPTDVGAYTGSASPYGTFDQSGNVMEWTEQIVGGSSQSVRGGGFPFDASYLAASFPVPVGPRAETPDLGFRVATVPEPGYALLVLTGGLVLAVVRKRHAQAL